MATILDVAQLTKTYGRLAALSNVSFSVRPGEILGLIGPNGAGKTTLFECVAGLLPRDSGSIQFHPPPGSTPGAPTLFYLPDAITPWPSQSVEWALRFAQGFFGGDAAVRDELIGRLHLTPLLEQPLGTLSKGQRKRAMLAMGLLMPHPLLLADEPFEGLDLRQTREVAALLRAHVSARRTLFLSIHQISEAARVCDRLVLLSAGRVCGEGTIEELAAIAAASDNRPPSRDLEEVFLALT